MGIIAGNRASDQAALDDYLLPDLRNAGVTPVVKTIDADPDDTATTGAEAPSVVQQLRSAGVTSVIPLMPFNVFFPVLQAETDQQWFPKLLLSDYEESIESSLGLMPVPYAKALNGQEGVTTETLGGIDSPRPQSQGGYDPGLRSCWVLWHKAYPQVPPGNMNDVIEEQGPIAGWCQAIDLFTTAARNAGPDLNRRTFVTAMSKIKDFPAPGLPSSATVPTSGTVRPSTRWSNCASTHRRRLCARRRAGKPPPGDVLGHPSSRSSPCPPADRKPDAARRRFAVDGATDWRVTVRRSAVVEPQRMEAGQRLLPRRRARATASSDRWLTEDVGRIRWARSRRP